MKIEIIAENGTKPETLAQLLQEVPKAFPTEINLVEGGRYNAALSNPMPFRYVLPSLYSKVAAVEGDGEVWLNVTRLRRLYKQTDLGVIIVTHHPFIEFRANSFPLTYKVGEANGTFYYAGNCADRMVVAGISNKIDVHNPKIIAHEITHMLLNPVFGCFYDESLQSINDCDNYTEQGKCLMNVPASNLYTVTSEDLEQVDLKFCNPCYNKLKSVEKLHKI